MPEVLTNVPTQDGFTSSCAVIESANTQQVTFVGTGNDYIARVYVKDLSDPNARPKWDGVDRFYPAGTGDAFGALCGGIYFRSAVAGSPAVMLAQQAFVGDVISAAPAYGNASACCDGMSLDTTDGSLSVDPTGVLLIGDGLTLTEPSPGTARIDAAGGSGIMFDTSPQAGTFLEASTTGPGPSGYGIDLASTGGGTQIASDTEILLTIPETESQLDLTPTDVTLSASADLILSTTGGSITADANTDVTVSVNGTKLIEAKLLAGPLYGLGFFGASPVIQQAAPASAQDIADALAAYGLLTGPGVVPSGIGFGANTGADLTINTTGGGGITLHDADLSVSSGIILQSDNSFIGLYANNTTGVIQLQTVGGRGIEIGYDPTDKVGFYGAAPAAQQATPVTLADVIALLQTYGLSA